MFPYVVNENCGKKYTAGRTKQYNFAKTAKDNISGGKRWHRYGVGTAKLDGCILLKGPKRSWSKSYSRLVIARDNV